MGLTKLVEALCLIKLRALWQLKSVQTVDVI